LGGPYVRQAAHSASAASTLLCFLLLFFFRIRPVKPHGLTSFVDLYLIQPALPLRVTFVDICLASKVLLAYVFSSLSKKEQKRNNARRLHGSHEY
jgi:hypothetical protein